MHISRGASGSRYESGGHSTNLAKLNKKASLTGYSTLSPASERALGDALEKSQQIIVKAEARRIPREAILAAKRRTHSDPLSRRICRRPFIIGSGTRL